MATKTKAPKKSSRVGTIDPDRLYDFEQAAEFYSATPRQVRRWTEEGKHPYVELPAGRGRRIRGQQILDMMDAGTVDREDF